MPSKIGRGIKMEPKQKILHEAASLFMKFGFKSITMDDIAREMGVSKKTLYQYFTDKNDLVNQTIDEHLQFMETNCSRITDENQDAVSTMINITKFVSGTIKQVNYKILFDLKKYFREAWDKMTNHRISFISEHVYQNINAGISQGLYRSDLNAKLISRMYVHLVDFLVDPDWLEKEGFDLKHVHIQIIEFHLRAICTDKGIKILNQKLQNLKA